VVILVERVETKSIGIVISIGPTKLAPKDEAIAGEDLKVEENPALASLQST
jgi:hypothetical protein